MMVCIFWFFMIFIRLLCVGARVFCSPPFPPPHWGKATYVLRVASLAVHPRLGLLRVVRVWAVLVRCPSDGLGLRG